MALSNNTRFTEDHEWADNDGNNEFTIGITQYAAAELGDIVYVELPEPGDQIERGEPFGSVESVKAVSDLIAPISGKVLKINEALEDAPETVNESPEQDGWMIIVEADDSSELDGLMDTAGYEKFTAGL